MTLALLRTLLLPLFVGAALARALGLAPRTSALAWAAWSQVLGALATALVTFLWLLTPLDKGSALAPELALLALGAMAWLAGRRAVPLAPAPAPAGPTWERLLFALVAAAAAVVTLQRILDGDLVPIFADDEAHVWGLKAKVVYAAGGFNGHLAEALADSQYVYHRDYPLLIPLLEIWTFAHFGEVTHVVSRLPVQLFSLSLVAALTAGLARVVRPAAGAALLLIVLDCGTMLHQARTAHADLAVALGLLLALDAWLRWRDTGERGWLKLCAAGAALALFAKGEGLLFALAVAAGSATARLIRGRALGAPGGARAPPWAWLCLPAGIVLLTWSFNAWWGFENDVATTDLRDESFLAILWTEGPGRLPVIARFAARELLLQRRWAGHLPSACALLALLLAPRLRRDALAVPALAAAAAFTGLLLVFAGSPHNLAWHLPTALPRVAWQLSPALALWLAACAGRFLPGFGATLGGTRPTPARAEELT